MNKAGWQFLKTSQTKENQQSTEQLLLKNAVIKSEAPVCAHSFKYLHLTPGIGVVCRNCKKVIIKQTVL